MCLSVLPTTPPFHFTYWGTTTYRDFNWSILSNELASKAPMLLAVLKAASGCNDTSQKALIPVEVAASVLLYTRSKHHCRIQTFVGGVLYAGHAAKKVVCALFL